MPLRDSVGKVDGNLLDFPSHFNGLMGDQLISAPLLTQDQLMEQRREEADARETERTDQLISQLPQIMEQNGYPVGASFMSRWLKGETKAGNHVESDKQCVSWEFLRRFERVNDGLTNIQNNITVVAGGYISRAGYFSTTQPVAESYDKLQKFLKKSKKQIQTSGESDEYRFYIGSEVVSYVGRDNQIIDDDLSVAMGRFPLKTHLLGRIGKFDKNSKAYPFTFSSYQVSVADSYDFGEKDDPFWKNQLLGKWGRKGMQDPEGVLLWNSSFQNYAQRHGVGRDFDVRTDNALLKTLNTPKTIYLVPATTTD